MDRQDRHRFVQQYVEQQKAYLPTYTAEHLLNECHGTPSKPLRSNEFGFDTPVLRPRVLEDKAAQPQLSLQTGARKSRTHGAEPDPLSNQAQAGPPPARPGEAPSETQDTAPGKKDKSRPKRKKASTPIDTDNERVARLAGRRERKRKKRAIVNPPQKHDDDIVFGAAPKKGRASGQKAKKPPALALLYGFSATNVTKDRLTLKPAPSLGVFSKGRASAKKKVANTGKSSSRNEFFSESAFLNKPSERVADHSRIDDDSDDSSVSSISNHPMPRDIRGANRTKEDRGKCSESPTPKPPTRTAAGSEVWDIEVQSKLPSSARDVSSDTEAEDPPPVILDLRGAEWAASINMTKEREERRTKAGMTRSRSRGRSVVCGSLPAIHDELGLARVADAPSIHPSHSASQAGRRATDIQCSDLHVATSKYFTEPKPAIVEESTALAPPASRSNFVVDALDSQTSGQDVEDAASDVQTIQRVAPSISPLIGVPRPLVEFQTRCDAAPLEFPSDSSPWDDCYARVDMATWEPPGGSDRGYFESSVVELPSDPSISAAGYHYPHQSTTWDWCRPWHSADLTTDDDVEDIPVEAFQDPYDPLAPESAVEPCSCEAQAEYDRGEGQWFCMAETGQDFPAHEDVPVGGSICDSEESLGCGEPGEGVPGFLEGRALLLGVSEDHSARPWCGRLSGLVQAEMDVASRLRDHWRPLRL